MDSNHLIKFTDMFQLNYNRDVNKIGGQKNKYPEITNSDFQKQIGNIFKKYKITKKLSFKEICWPEKFTYQPPQLFVADYINPVTPYKGILLFHKIGAGKTCAAVNIAEQWKHKRKIIFVCPASLVGNIYKELRSPCAGNEYITAVERKDLAKSQPGSDLFNQTMTKVKKRIDKYYSIMSYNKFVDLSQRGRIDLTNSVLLIDEVQNIVSERGTFYQTFLHEIRNAPSNLRTVIMSATPMFDKPVELALTMNLLRPYETIPINPKFNQTFLKQKVLNDFVSYDLKNAAKLKKMLMGYVSYFKGAPDHAFPTKTFKVIRARMSSYQYSIYKTVNQGEGSMRDTDILQLPNDFFIGSRMVSNIAFPNRLIGDKGFDAFKGKALTEDLPKYSVKFYKILSAIKRSKQLNFVYSNFRGHGGIASFIKVLEANGFKNFKTHGPGKNRYAIWSGEEDLKYKELTRETFNRKENENGSLVKVVLGSPAIKEGVSLLRVRKVHVMEPYWNMSRLEQVIGRAVRFCSHKDMHKDEREVKIYVYLGVDPQNKILTVDRHILHMAYSKSKLIKQFDQVLKDSAVDYHLFQ